jgi:hypothetical protein
MRFVRSVVAVVGAFMAMTVVVMVGTVVASALLAGPDGGVTGSYLAANLVVSGLGAVVAAWVVYRLAPGRPGVHVVVLALMMAALSLPTILAGGDPIVASGEGVTSGRPAGYHALVLVVGYVGLGAGFWWSRRRGQLRGRESPAV